MTKKELEYGKVLVGMEDFGVVLNEAFEVNKEEDACVDYTRIISSMEQLKAEIHSVLKTLPSKEIMSKPLDYLDLPKDLYWKFRNKGVVSVKDLLYLNGNEVYNELSSGSYNVLRMRMLLKGLPTHEVIRRG